ncbi:unnamed protein product, partial [Heterotrigona itama]
RSLRNERVKDNLLTFGITSTACRKTQKRKSMETGTTNGNARKNPHVANNNEK